MASINFQGSVYGEQVSSTNDVCRFETNWIYIPFAGVITAVHLIFRDRGDSNIQCEIIARKDERFDSDNYTKTEFVSDDMYKVDVMVRFDRIKIIVIDSNVSQNIWSLHELRIMGEPKEPITNVAIVGDTGGLHKHPCLLYTSSSPRDS